MSEEEREEAPFVNAVVIDTDDGIEVCDPKEIDLTTIDYVIAYQARIKASSNQKAVQILENRKIYLHNLERNGLVLKKMKEDCNGTPMFFILVETSKAVQVEIAEKINLNFPIEENDLYEAKDPTSLLNRLRCFFPDESDIDLKDSYRKYFTAAYTSNLHEKFRPFLDKNQDLNISNKDRCLIAYEVLSRTSFSKKDDPSIFVDNKDKDKKIGIELLVMNGTFSAAFPMHEDYGHHKRILTVKKKTNRQLLWDYWANPKSFYLYQPIYLIREYFGEKLAFYFSWLGFYTTWLVMPSIIGIFVFIYGLLSLSYDIPTNDICNKQNGSGAIIMCPLCDSSHCEFWALHNSCLYSKITYLVDNPATVFFSIFMAVWTVIFIESWKRKQSRLQFEWDITGFGKETEMLRPEFELQVPAESIRINKITKEYEPFVPLSKIFQRYAFSAIMVLFMICLVLALVFGVIVYRVVLMMVLSRSESTRKYSGPITSFTAASINLIIIIILGRFYAWMAGKLTDLEYHRTDSKYEDSLTIKMYLFQFVNYYASIFYIAFFKGRSISKHQPHNEFEYNFQEECDQSGCLIELCIQLAIIMVGKQVLNNFQEVLFPKFWNYMRRYNNNKKSSHKPSPWKEDFNLMAWSSLTLFDEYLEMVIQFGFITLFVVAFPLGPLFAFLNNILEIRIDAEKVLNQLRRPIPRPAKDIGIWLPILNIISKLGVITNGAIIAFTSEFIPRLVYKYGYGNGSLDGYVDFTLSYKNTSDLSAYKTSVNYQNITTCRYRDYREPFDSVDKYQFTVVHYQVLAARLFFFVCFEHIVFLILTILHTFIPSVPNDVNSQIKREQFIVQKALWQARSHVPRPIGFVEPIDERTDSSNNINHTFPTTEFRAY